MKRLFFLVSLLGLLGGCTSQVVIDKQASLQAREGLKTVFRNAISEGKILKDKLPGEKRRLDDYLSFVKAHPLSDSKLFAHHEARLTYALNIYLAMGLRGLIEKQMPATLGGWSMKRSFYHGLEFHFWDKPWTLDSFYHEVLLPMGEPRAKVAAHNMTRGGGLLPQAPFRTTHVDGELDALCLKYFNDPGFLKVDDEQNHVFLTELLLGDLAWVGGTEEKLFEFLNKYFSTRIPESYETQSMAPNWDVQYADTP